MKETIVQKIILAPQKWCLPKITSVRYDLILSTFPTIVGRAFYRLCTQCPFHLKEMDDDNYVLHKDLK